VRRVLGVLGRDAPHYLYISTVSVYDSPAPRSDESAPLLRVDEGIAPESRDAYGGLKVLCEETLRDALGDRLTVLRPTVVIGPYDYTDRFPWWVRSVARGGRMLVPRRMEQPVQLIDAGDLGAFALHTLEERIFGVFNAVGPQERLTLGGLVRELVAAFGASVEVLPDEGGGSSYPLALVEDGSSDGYFAVSGAAAYQAGLSLRPISESGLDVLHAQAERAESR